MVDVLLVPLLSLHLTISDVTMALLLALSELTVLGGPLLVGLGLVVAALGQGSLLPHLQLMLLAVPLLLELFDVFHHHHISVVIPLELRLCALVLEAVPLRLLVVLLLEEAGALSGFFVHVFRLAFLSVLLLPRQVIDDLLALADVLRFLLLGPVRSRGNGALTLLIQGSQAGLLRFLVLPVLEVLVPLGQSGILNTGLPVSLRTPVLLHDVVNLLFLALLALLLQLMDTGLTLVVVGSVLGGLLLRDTPSHLLLLPALLALLLDALAARGGLQVFQPLLLLELRQKGFPRLLSLLRDGLGTLLVQLVHLLLLTLALHVVHAAGGDGLAGGGRNVRFLRSGLRGQRQLFSVSTFAHKVEPLHDPLIPRLLVVRVELGVLLAEGVELDVRKGNVVGLAVLQLIRRECQHLALNTVEYRNDVVLIAQLLAPLEHEGALVITVVHGVC
mmetsp:Transcript_2459/g.5617  ORF Transcript_2459/g.5617 Transcript_2459/m.5617 type:complete len:445 (+) Transcript_2459:623-1957(+)